jgi:hypothetical protein
MPTRAATAAEVRRHHKLLDNTVRIDREGHVEFKSGGEGPWLDGGRVSDYHHDEVYIDPVTKAPVSAPSK